MLRSRQNKVYGKFIMFTNNPNKLEETLKPIVKLLYTEFFTQMIKICFSLLFCIESQFSTYFNKVITYLFEMHVVLQFTFRNVNYCKIHLK
jgi:hypothetical protein